MMVDFIKALGQNLVLILALAYLYSLIWPWLKLKSSLSYKPLMGVLFGVMGVLAMQSPIPLAPGVFTDGRDLFIALVGIMEGVESASSAAIIIILARLMTGGVGTYAGIGVAVTAVIAGLGARRFLNKPISKASSTFFIVVGIVLSLLGRFWALTLPNGIGVMIVQTTTLQLLILSPLETLLLGHLLAREIRRQEIDMALKESETRFVKVFNSSPVAISISGLYDGRLVDVNDSYLRLMGFLREEALGHDYRQLNVWVDVAQRARIVEQLQSGQSVYNQELELRTKSGEIIQVLTSVVIIELNQQPHALYLTLDNTARKRAEAALQKLNVELEGRVAERTASLQSQQLLLQTILDSMGDGVIYSSNGMIRYTNPALHDICGYSGTDLQDQPNTILLAEKVSADEIASFANSSFDSDSTWRSELSFKHKDGHMLQVALTRRRVPEIMRGLGGEVTLVRDITTEKELAEQKARFIANASHELRTPLTNLVTRLYVMRRQPEAFETHLAVLEKISSQMASLVEDLLDIARFERGAVPLNLDRVKLQELVNEVLVAQQFEAEKKAITLKSELPPDPIFTTADPKRLTQVITNLVVNAIHYTPNDGSIVVHLQTKCVDDHWYVRLSVKDTGIGINPENLTRIFEPFFRVEETHGRGTGLGLSISKQIVTQHGGSLYVESEFGKGSTFTVDLPSQT
jgi:PAS domain S-box-containing protein